MLYLLKINQFERSYDIEFLKMNNQYINLLKKYPL